MAVDGQALRAVPDPFENEDRSGQKAQGQETEGTGGSRVRKKEDNGFPVRNIGKNCPEKNSGRGFGQNSGKDEEEIHLREKPGEKAFPGGQNQAKNNGRFRAPEKTGHRSRAAKSRTIRKQNRKKVSGIRESGQNKAVGSRDPDRDSDPFLSQDQGLRR